MTPLLQCLPELNSAEIQELIDLFENNSEIQELPQRRFALDLTAAIEIVRPVIDSVLGENTWELSGGNFFETETGYRVHADTGKAGPEKVWQTFVFPLRQEYRTDIPVLPERNRLIVLEQSWAGPAAFFLRGDDATPIEYNSVVRDYQSVIDIREDRVDPVLLEYCPHLNAANFIGLTVDTHWQWIPGRPMTFPRNRLHCSSAFPRNGIKKKLGLSIFTSRRDVNSN